MNKLSAPLALILFTQTGCESIHSTPDKVLYRVTVGWTPPPEPVIGFVVYCEPLNFIGKTSKFPTTATQFTLALTPEIWRVWVTARNAAGESMPSNVIQIKVRGPHNAK